MNEVDGPKSLANGEPEAPKDNEHAFWREGKLLVIKEGAVLPPRCPICNHDVEGEPIRMTFGRNQRGFFKDAIREEKIAAGIRSPFTGPIKLNIRFCMSHQARRRNLLVVSISMTVLSALGFPLLGGIGGNSHPITSTSDALLVALFVAPFFGGLAVTRFIFTGEINPWFRAKKFDDRWVWLAGADPMFLDSLSESRKSVS